MQQSLPPEGPTATVDLDLLFKLRLAIARIGEMDNARWWNTNGVLGKRGAMVTQRGMPVSHFFAQARVVFAVARSRCKEIFAPPGCITLWELPADLEDRFETRWHDWLDDHQAWGPYFERIQGLDGSDVLATLLDLELVTPEQVESARGLKRAAENRAVPLPGTHTTTDEVIAQLALGFFRGEPGKPAIPYARLED